MIVHIGTSGWHYDHWEGPFYPEGTAKKEYLEFYAQRFLTAEINNTFYQVPHKNTLIRWRDAVPQNFIFSVKASRYITHMKKLKDPQQALSKFLKQVEVLGDKLGPILFQLPPRWNVNPERLDSFLKALPASFRYTFEFRDPSWCQDCVYDLLTERDAAFCMYDFDRHQSPTEVTAGFVYIRLHGPEGPYKGKYNSQSLSGWAGAIHAWAKREKEVFCYFDNDQSGYAAQNALDLKGMIGED
ncbi:MAG: DUF72 domain-containing protein [Candidatus Aminicenantes bacterium]|jgi:uncharacterized protein YecE (DUF72 family)